MLYALKSHTKRIVITEYRIGNQYHYICKATGTMAVRVWKAACSRTDMLSTYDQRYDSCIIFICVCLCVGGSALVNDYYKFFIVV